MSISWNRLKYVRPFSTKLRQVIFSAIGEDIIGSNILELFAGSGKHSVNALIKGARHACLVDNNYSVIRKLYSRVNKDDIRDYTKIYNGNIGKVLYSLYKLKRFYDIVFIDPPYNMRLPKTFWLSLERVLCDNDIIMFLPELHLNE